MQNSADSDDAFVPLDAYGLVGNAETAALVSDRGAVDWLPFPELQSASVFAAVLDAEGGGHFSVCPTDDYDSEQAYRDRTNVLETTFRTDDGRATVTDFMPIRDREYPEGTPDRAIYRRLTGEEGTVDFRVEFAPEFDYARTDPDLSAVERRGEGNDSPTTVRATGGGNDPDLLLAGDWAFDIDPAEPAATATATVGPDETRWLVLADELPESDHRTVLEATTEFWRGWAHDCPDESACVFGGPWHDEVVRSGLTLKLLTHDDTGAIAAAPTTSLPEEIGGVRNWDYRYNWIRDAAFTAQALYNLGHEAEAESHLTWFMDLCSATTPEDIQPLYGLHGETDLEERELTHLSGYRDSSPVRVGNAAEDQLQLDVYGELLDAVYEITRYGLDIDEGDWATVRDVVEYVRDIWDRPDEGIWEVRCDPQHFVYSKAMCWVALDRGVEMLDNAGFDGPRAEWVETREEIRAAILDRGYDEDLGSFVRSFDGDDLDATGLLLPIVGFLPFDDDRVQGTIDATMDRLVTDGGLVMRYEGADGLPGDEGAFLLCSFWLVDALALSGRRAEAREVFENVLEYVSPVGLLSEEVDPETGGHLGNTPQAFSHIGLVNSALYLGRTEGRKQQGPEPKGSESSQEVASED